ncbi:hypothetical protein HPB51_029613 [Rhipicephalus microplus]|uniref:Uncharacterized protein n=1 Tax=Rhipicephalus microplus TaxID=6941 RepID=A0A9J6CUA8_RHIMP|nr:hypothetical protein HPB51_029613 [Rhipicephalus microplus]
MPGTTTVEKKRAKQVRMLASVHGKTTVTAMLCYTSDGHKLPPYLIFKWKTLPKGVVFSSGVIVRANEKNGDAKELQSWIDTLNFVTASLSAPALAGAVGSQKRFQRPLLPVSHTKFNLREQLTDHENRIVWLEKELEEHVANAPEKGAKSRTVAEFVEKESFLQNELKRYRTYAYLLRSKMAQYPELVPALVETSIGEVDEPEQNHGGSHGCANNPPLPSPSRTKQPSHKALPSSPALGLPSSAFSAPAVASSCSPRSSPTAVRNKRIAQDRFSYRTAVQKGGDLGT